MDGTVTDAMRREWDKKIGFVMADKRNEAYLFDHEQEFVDKVWRMRTFHDDLSERQSLWLNRIYQRILRRVG